MFGEGIVQAIGCLMMRRAQREAMKAKTRESGLELYRQLQRNSEDMVRMIEIQKNAHCLNHRAHEPLMY